MRAGKTLSRRVVTECAGTAALVAVVIGSGAKAVGLSRDPGVQLLANSLASALALTLLLTLLGPVSGGHLNPVVTLLAWSERRRGGEGPPGRDAALYIGAQLAGAVAGSQFAGLTYGREPAHWSVRERSEPHLLLAEAAATAGLVVLITGLRRTGRARWTPLAVGGYLAAAIWWSSSGSFANPAGTAGRALGDSFTGIAPGSVPGYVAAQLTGWALGVAVAAWLYGPPERAAAPAAPAAVPQSSGAAPAAPAALAPRP
ncbi:aquaporin [Streptomyces sp. NPDC050504]|uniref:aquaporin n=1 Tax=Streptomyces sp. NPDC050504 TaxID=3365618 RepID=UPI0037A428A2